MNTIEQIKARLAAASPGPWGKCTAHEGKCSCTSIWDGLGSYPVLEVTRGEWGDPYASLRFVEGEVEGTIGAKVEAYNAMIVYGDVPDELAQANKEFIANAPADIAFLLARIAELESPVLEEPPRARHRSEHVR